MDLSQLPNIVLEGAFASQLGVAPNGLMRMVDEGTLPPPFGRRVDKPVWSEADIVDFFGRIQPAQSAYAPIDPVLGQSELDLLESYVCPAVSSGHIGNRRPSHLVLYKGGAPRNGDGFYELVTYPVQWVQTQRGVAGETLAVPAGVNPAAIAPVPWNRVRPGDEGPLTLFKLDVAAGRTLLTKTGVRRGGTVSTESLLEALGLTPRRPCHFKGGKVHLID